MGHGKPNGGFEREDLGSKPIIAFIVTVVVLGVFVYYGLWGMFRVMDKEFTKNEQTMSPMVQPQADTRESSHAATAEKIQQDFKEPRLEDNEITELNDTRYGEEERLNSSGWVDQSAGVAHIPITQAMALIAQRGLPTAPQAGNVPASTVNIARQAAAQSDTSNVKAQKGKKQ